MTTFSALSKRALIVCALLASALSSPVAATDPKPHLIIELNNLEQRTGACRLSLLIENRLGSPLRDLAFELVLFDKNQRISQLLAVPAGAFPKSKSRVKQFDIKSIECAAVSRILFNTISRCKARDMTPDKCLAVTRTRSRTTVPLTY